MLRINLTKKAHSSKIDTPAIYQIACLSSSFQRGTTYKNQNFLLVAH